MVLDYEASSLLKGQEAINKVTGMHVFIPYEMYDT